MGKSFAIAPCELREANAFVEMLHRHHNPVRGHRWSTKLLDNGTIVGVAIVGRPVARACNPSKIVEITRLCTDGTFNACSALYGAVCRQQRALGYDKAQTYILASEPGTSLLASGWKPVARVVGRQWDTPSRFRNPGVEVQNQNKIRWECPCSDLPSILEVS